MIKIFRLKTSLRSAMCDEFPENFCTRTIDISGKSSLETLAESIISAYGFDMDHAFGFYNNLSHHYESDEAYSLFADMDLDAPSDGKSVRKNKVSTTFAPEKTMLFLFDYGDEWIFYVECLSVNAAEKGTTYPAIVGSKGEAPEQYPTYDEEEEEVA